MKLKYEFVTTEIDAQIVAVPVGDDVSEFNGIIKINDSAKAVLDLLSEEITEEEIVALLLKTYTQSSKEEISSYVHEFTMKLKAEGVLE